MFSFFFLVCFFFFREIRLVLILWYGIEGRMMWFKRKVEVSIYIIPSILYKFITYYVFHPIHWLTIIRQSHVSNFARYFSKHPLESLFFKLSYFNYSLWYKRCPRWTSFSFFFHWYDCSEDAGRSGDEMKHAACVVAVSRLRGPAFNPWCPPAATSPFKPFLVILFTSSLRWVHRHLHY